MAELPQYDLAKELIGKLFGPGWENIRDNVTGTSLDPDTAAQLIFVIFKQINSFVIAGIGVYSLIILTRAIIGTAHEGTVLGRSLSTVWTPIRWAIGLVLATPLGVGLSILQIVILSLVAYSSGFDNGIWEKSTNYFEKELGFSAPRHQEHIDDSEMLAEEILRTLVFQHYHTMRLNRTLVGGLLFTTGETTTGTGAEQRVTQNFYFSAPQGVGAWWSSTGAQNPEMTRIQIEGDPSTSVVCQARVDGITGLVADLKSVAAGLVSINSEGLNVARPVTKDFNLAVDRYNTTVKAGMTAHINNQQPHHAQELQKFTTAAKTQGWITAGQIYWAALNIRNQVHEELRKVPQVRSLSQNLISATTNERQLGEYLDLVSHFVTSTRRDRADATGQLLDDVPDPAAPGDDPEAGWAQSVFTFFKNGWKKYKGSFGGKVANILDQIISIEPAVNRLAQGQDPVLFISDYGHKLLWAGHALVAVGASVGLLAPAAGLAIISLGGICYTGGFGLAYYLPAIPIILWTLAVIGWLILILEAVFAAPIWAASHILPEGEGFAGPAARQGYFLLLTLLIRPVFMLCGLLLAMVLMSAIGGFIGQTFQIFAANMNTNRIIGPVGSLMMLIVLGGLLMSVAHRVFGLITYLPNNVMRWIGHIAPSGQSGQGEAAARTAAAAGGAALMGGLGRAPQAGMAGTAAAGKGAGAIGRGLSRGARGLRGMRNK